MLTDKDRETQAATGRIPVDRMLALGHAMLARHDDAIAAAVKDGLDERFVASLLGKATTYQYVADLVLVLCAQAAAGLIRADVVAAFKQGLLTHRDDMRASARRAGLAEGAAAERRGSVHAYQEAADLVQQLLYGAPMRAARWSTARRRAREYQARRQQRKTAALTGTEGTDHG